MVDLLASHRRGGRRLEPTEFIEHGPRVAVRLTVTDPDWPERGETYKVFTFRDPGEHAIMLEDCVDRDDALAKFAAG